MKTIITIVLLGIIVICVWSGYKKGLVMGVGGILAIIVSLYGANLLANTFSYEVVSALKPFGAGYMEQQISAEDGVLSRMGWDDYDYSVSDLLTMFPDSETDFCETCYETIGIHASAAKVMAQEAVSYAKTNAVQTTDAVSEILCERVSFVGCFVLAFLLLIIILTVIGNLPNLSYKLPHMDTLNDVGGAVLGLVTGLMFCAILVWALKFTGKIIGSDTLSSNGLLRLLLEHNFLTRFLGV